MTEMYARIGDWEERGLAAMRENVRRVNKRFPEWAKRLNEQDREILMQLLCDADFIVSSALKIERVITTD